MPNGTPAPLLGAGDADEVHLVFPEEVQKELQHHLFPVDEDHPFHGMWERGAFCVVTRSTGRCRVSYLVREVIPPESENDLYSPSRGHGSRWDGSAHEGQAGFFGAGLRFSKEYHRRALDRAKELSAGLLRVHTQPGGVGPSHVDMRSADRVFGGNVGRLPLGAPLVAAITNDQGAWSSRIYEFGSDDAPSITPVTAVRIVGPRFRKLETPASPTGPGGAYGPTDDLRQDSSVQLWGEEGQKLLAGLRIGLVGCGGVGSLLASQLPRLGVGELVVIDFDRLKPANANRADGAAPEDIEQNRLKTAVAKREAEKGATTPGFDVKAIDGSVIEDDQDYAAVPDLLDCDVIISVVDAARPRKVLDHLASSHCIPVINAGSRLHVEDNGTLQPAAKIETTVTGPGFPCFRCQKVWSQGAVEYEGDDPRFRGDRTYVDGGVDPEEEPRDPSVIGINSIVAGLVQHRLQALVLGVAKRVTGIHRLKPYNLSSDWSGGIMACPDGCGRAPVAAGDGHRLPLGTDWAMRYEREDIPDPPITTIDPARAQELLDPLSMEDDG